MPYPAIDIRKVHTVPLPARKNRVNTDDFIGPKTPLIPFDSPDLIELSQRIIKARQEGHPVLCLMGAHVIKCGLAPIIISLMENGFIQQIGSNGAATIHDFEIALLGGTSEDVADSLRDGTFGMAEETGSIMNRAIQNGAKRGMGIGESLGELIGTDERFAEYRSVSVLYNAWRLGIPYTVHVAIGTDIIHQHPAVDFAAIGWASGQDFKIFAHGVCKLEGGVYLNIGTAVVGPEVFLKSLSIARNLGNPLRVFTTANFDLMDLGDYRASIGMDKIEYFYRPRKNVINRPVMLGGKGFHICGDHVATLPNLYHLLTKDGAHFAVESQKTTDASAALLDEAAAAILARETHKHPELADVREELVQSYALIKRCWVCGGTLYTAGNGGSMSDALHISGELLKAFMRHRHVPETLAKRLELFEDGSALADNLEPAQRVVVLGNNPAIRSAVDNDFKSPAMAIAQELYALAKPGDVMISISTSGNAQNLHHAAHLAKTQDVYVIGMTGRSGGLMRQDADILIAVNSDETPEIQNRHIVVYHTLCMMLETLS